MLVFACGHCGRGSVREGGAVPCSRAGGAQPSRNANRCDPGARPTAVLWGGASRDVLLLTLLLRCC